MQKKEQGVTVYMAFACPGKLAKPIFLKRLTKRLTSYDPKMGHDDTKKCEVISIKGMKKDCNIFLNSMNQDSKKCKLSKIDYHVQSPYGICDEEIKGEDVIARIRQTVLEFRSEWFQMVKDP